MNFEGASPLFGTFTSYFIKWQKKIFNPVTLCHKRFLGIDLYLLKIT